MKVGIFSNEDKDRDNLRAVKLSELLGEKGVEVFIFNNSDKPFLNDIFGETGISLLMVMGGDGTILGVVNAAANNNIPIIGINMGNIGFLTELEPDTDYEKVIKEYEAGNYLIDERMMLDVNVRGETYRALNEVLISRHEDCCVSTVDVIIDDTVLDRYIGDGVIVATPTGSTAYSLSAGGPILSPDIEALIINPVCPHTLHNRPIVISDTHTIRLKLVSSRMKGRITVDGRTVAIIDNLDESVVTRSNVTAKFLRFSNLNFYKRLLIKMNYWSNPSGRIEE
jgi:NAD+ kinase